MLEKLADGRMVQDVGAALTPAAHGAIDRAARNSSGRVWLANGEAFAVSVGGKSIVVASGIAQAKAGRRCALYVRVRAEADVAEPKLPVTELEP